MAVQKVSVDTKQGDRNHKKENTKRFIDMERILAGHVFDEMDKITRMDHNHQEKDDH